MKASVLNETGGVLQLQDVAMPVPQGLTALIKVDSIGVNLAESQMRLGQYPVKLPVPVILGSEVAGIVVEVGDRSIDHLIGKRVVAALPAAGIFTGGYAEYVVAPSHTIVEIPENVSFEEAVSVPIQGLTAYYLLTRASRLSKNDSIFIQAAAGGVGSIAVQLAKILGARQVIGGVSNSSKLELVKSLGADVIINYSDGDWTGQVMKATGGKGVDIVLSSGSSEMTKQSLKLLAYEGRFVVFGSIEVNRLTFDSDQMTKVIFNNQSIIGFVTALVIADPENLQTAARHLLYLISSGALKIITTSQYKLYNAQQALEDMASRKTTGKVILKP